MLPFSVKFRSPDGSEVVSRTHCLYRFATRARYGGEGSSARTWQAYSMVPRWLVACDIDLFNASRSACSSSLTYVQLLAELCKSKGALTKTRRAKRL